jgi:hypothetical protein
MGFVLRGYYGAVRRTAHHTTPIPRLNQPPLGHEARHYSLDAA